MFKCSKCNAQFAENSNFCELCGAPLVAADTSNTASKTKKSFPKLLTIAIPCVAIVLVAAILLSTFIFKPKGPNYVFYKKDGELWFTKASKIAPREMTDDLDGSSARVKVSADGKYIFFADKTEDSTGFTLFYTKANDKKGEPVKIDSNVVSYQISKDGKCVTYIKGGDASSILYQHNLKERTKIAGDVSEYYVSTNGKKIYYTVYDKDEKNLYLKDGKKDATKLASNISSLQFNEKFDTVYYKKDKVLYKQVGKKDAVKIASDVGTFLAYESGDMYYTKVTESEEKTETSFYFYDGKEEKLIADSFVGMLAGTIETPLVVYATSKEDGDSYKTEYFAAIKDVSCAIDVKEDYEYEFAVTEDGKSIYYFCMSTKDNEKELGEIFEIAVSGKKLKAAESIDKDVSNNTFDLDGGKYLVYGKDYKNDSGTLYIDAEKVADDVDEFYYYEDANIFVYYTDVNDKGIGTLHTYKKGKSTKISDEVYDFELTPGGDILYIKDYNNNKGDLYIYTGKSKKVDEDVSSIITFGYVTSDDNYLYGSN